ncbi:MAG: hypothetical protein ACI4RR_05895 [Eubacterium sp.]
MSSTNKTQNLGLNSWVPTDVPKRIDFNYDNEVIDRVISQHHSDEVRHITYDERERWNSMVYTGMYFGNGSDQRTINTNCPFEASFMIVYASARPTSTVDFSQAKKYNCFACATPIADSLGIKYDSEQGTITVINTVLPVYGSEHVNLNESGTAYTYVMFR